MLALERFAGLLVSQSCAAVAVRRLSQATTAPDVQRVDCVVIGAGVVGLACARSIAGQGREVVIIEQESTFGTGTSSRHSEVIHAGLYYPANSLKARFCVEGKHRLYDYCQQNGVNHQKIGKLIVASSGRQVPQLRAIQANAAACGVPDLELISGEEACTLEPSLRCASALLSPSTGILDSHGYMVALLSDAEADGALLACNSRLVRGDVARSVKVLEVEDVASGATTQLHCSWLVNAAGLQAQAVAARLEGLPASTIPKQYLAKGSYFTLAGRAPFSRLIYPLPEDGGLGVHLTLDLGGQARFGPDVEWVSSVDYGVDPARADQFYALIRSYFPLLPDAALQPGYAGVRPKLSGPGQPAVDFLVHGPSTHGVRGLVTLYGIESPGLTSSLAIAQHVTSMLQAT